MQVIGKANDTGGDGFHSLFHQTRQALERGRGHSLTALDQMGDAASAFLTTVGTRPAQGFSPRSSLKAFDIRRRSFNNFPTLSSSPVQRQDEWNQRTRGEWHQWHQRDQWSIQRLKIALDTPCPAVDSHVRLLTQCEPEIWIAIVQL